MGINRWTVGGLLAVALCLAVSAFAPPTLWAAEEPAGSEAAAEPDATAGAVATTSKNLLQVLQDGGPLMIPIAICSVVLLIFIMERLISLRTEGVIPTAFVERFLEQLQEREIDRDEALTLCRENRSPVAEVFAAGVKKWGKPSVEVEQAILDEGERVASGLRSYLRLFSGIATISPLLGLLGTVLGMIQAFDAIVQAGNTGSPETIAAGISQALLTTAAGLTVAIPAYIAYLYFVSCVDGLIMEIDARGQRVVAAISAEAHAEFNARRSRKKAA